jgi:LysM repeat protein
MAEENNVKPGADKPEITGQVVDVDSQAPSELSEGIVKGGVGSAIDIEEITLQDVAFDPEDRIGGPVKPTPVSAAAKSGSAPKSEGLSADEKAIQEFPLLEFMEMLMTLKEAGKQGRLNSYFENIYKQAKEQGAPNPESAIADFMNPMRFREVEDAYPDIAKAVTHRVSTRYNDPLLTEQLATSTGFTKEEYASLPSDFRMAVAATAEFEKDFPPAAGKILTENLKASKDTLIAGLTSETGQKALKYAGWAIAIATGGVAVKLGTMGIMHVASKLMENDSVKAFVMDSLTSGAQSLKGMGVPVEKVAKGMTAVKEGTRSVWDNKFAKVGVAALSAVAVGLILNEFNFDKVLASADPFLSNAGDLASKAMDTAGSGLNVGNTIIGETARATTEAALNAGGNIADAATVAGGYAADAAGVVADAAVAGAGHFADAAGYLADKAVDGAGYVADVAVAGAGQVADAATYVFDKAVDGAGYVADAASDAYDNAKVAVGEGMQSAGKTIADAGQQMAGGDIVAGTPDIGFQDMSNDSAPDASELSSGAAPSAPEVPAPVAPGVPTEAMDAAPTSHTVIKGDTLSGIAEEQLKAAGIEATSENINATWRAVYEANQGIIGADPDLILPGQNIKIDASMLHGGPDVAISATAPQASIPVVDSKPVVGDYNQTNYADYQAKSSIVSLSMQETMDDVRREFEAHEAISEAIAAQDLKGAEPLSNEVSNGIQRVVELNGQGGTGLESNKNPNDLIRRLTEQGMKNNFDTGPGM